MRVYPVVKHVQITQNALIARLETTRGRTAYATLLVLMEPLLTQPISSATPVHQRVRRAQALPTARLVLQQTT